ncbi:MAG: oligosaccharide flippase family protein, partial [Firmicutes bacterium]|nr:oligosaccharide flippase family protein [Bacillota bacterium]
MALLTASNLFVKAAGLLFKIPLSRAMGDAGMGYLSAAYSIYTAFYMVSTAGLPVALAVLVAQNRAAGNVLGAKQIFRRSTALFVSVGLALSLVMLFFARGLALLIGSP